MLTAVQMEGMVTDLQLARDKQQNFDEWKREHAADKPLTMDLTVTVLTTGFWPSYKVHMQSSCLFLLLAQCPAFSALLQSLLVPESMYPWLITTAVRILCMSCPDRYAHY